MNSIEKYIGKLVFSFCSSITGEELSKTLFEFIVSKSEIHIDGLFTNVKNINSGYSIIVNAKCLNEPLLIEYIINKEVI